MGWSHQAVLTLILTIGTCGEAMDRGSARDSVRDKPGLWELYLWCMIGEHAIYWDGTSVSPVYCMGLESAWCCQARSHRLGGTHGEH